MRYIKTYEIAKKPYIHSLFEFIKQALGAKIYVSGRGAINTKVFDNQNHVSFYRDITGHMQTMEYADTPNFVNILIYKDQKELVEIFNLSGLVVWSEARDIKGKMRPYVIINKNDLPFPPEILKKYKAFKMGQRFDL